MQSKQLMNNRNLYLLGVHAVAVVLAVLPVPTVLAQEEAAGAAAEAAETDVILVEEVIEAPAPATTLERIAANGVIRLGYRTDASPFSYRDEGGQAAGFSITLCNRVADRVKSESGQSGLRVEWVEVGTEDRFSKVADGSVDLLCAADTVTLERRQEVSFSLPIFPGGIGALMRAESIERLRDALEGRAQKSQPLWRGNPATILQNRTFAVVSGTVAEPWVAERLNTFGVSARIQPVDSYDAGVEAVASGKADVLFGDRAILQGAARRSSHAADLKVAERLFTLEPLALALARGDDDFRLLVDSVLSATYASGEFEDLFTETFGEPNERVMLFYMINTQHQ
jgi:polar amino acid transport system substrate-binding protein